MYNYRSAPHTCQHSHIHILPRAVYLVDQRLGGLPGEVGVVAAEMAVGCRLLHHGATQVQVSAE